MSIIPDPTESDKQVMGHFFNLSSGRMKGTAEQEFYLWLDSELEKSCQFGVFEYVIASLYFFAVIVSLTISLH